MKKLNDCIVCNAIPTIVTITHRTIDLPRLHFHIECECGLHVDGSTFEEAVEKWNELELDDVLEII